MAKIDETEGPSWPGDDPGATHEEVVTELIWLRQQLQATAAESLSDPDEIRESIGAIWNYAPAASFIMNRIGEQFFIRTVANLKLKSNDKFMRL